MLVRSLVAAATLLLLASCSGSDFSSGAKTNAGGANAVAAKKKAEADEKAKADTDKEDEDGKGKDGKKGDTDAKDGKGKGKDKPKDGDTDAGGKTDPGSLDVDAAKNDGIIEEDGQLVKCPKKPQKILIMDYKSGWWAGDGGEFFLKVINGVHDECVGALTIEYHHIVTSGASVFFGGGGGGGGNIVNTQLIVPGGSRGPGGSEFQTAFADPSFGSYTQIWILSGARNDPMDLMPGDPFLEQVLTATVASSANLFIASGFGSIVTSNALTSKLGMGNVFTTNNEEGRLLNVMAGVSVNSVMKAKSQLKDHVLFSRGIVDVADDLTVGGIAASGDSCGNGGGLDQIATDAQGQCAIAAGARNGRKIVFDAGVQRYYAVWKDASPGTFQLLKNIITYLSK